MGTTRVYSLTDHDLPAELSLIKEIFLPSAQLSTGYAHARQVAERLKKNNSAELAKGQQVGLRLFEWDKEST